MRKHISTNDLAYTAGIVDGEGSISIIRSKSGRGKKTQRGYLLELRVAVSNTNEWLINWLLFQYGGCICKRKASKDEWKDYWEWKVQTAQALRFLELIKPYLRIKQPQAELAIIFGKRRKIGKKTQEETVEDEANRILMLSYNKKGKPA